MNINYDNNKLSEIIRNLVLKANQVETGSDLKNATSGDIKEMTKPEDPLFLNDTNFYDNYEAFQNSLNTAIDESILNKGKGIKYSDIVNKYNRLVKYITLNMKYYQLSKFKKDIIDKEMRKLVDDIDAVKKITPNKGGTEMYNLTLEKMINNLSGVDNSNIPIYDVVKVELKKTLEKAKQNLRNIESKLATLISDYKTTATTLNKNKIDSEYKKYLDIYRRIATLYTKTERNLFLINEPQFNEDIKNILGIDYTQDLRDIADRMTSTDARTFAQEGFATAENVKIEKSVPAPAPAIDEDQRAFLEEQRRKAEESISKPSTEKVIPPQEKITFIQDIIKYLNGEINKSQIKIVSASRNFIFEILSSFEDRFQETKTVSDDKDKLFGYLDNIKKKHL